MNRPLLSVLFAPLLFSFVGCTSQSSVEVGGVPKWIAGGAQLDAEPAPYRPDNALIAHESESGPIEFSMITDRRAYEAPPAKKRIKSSSDPLERGRERRIRRLFR